MKIKDQNLLIFFRYVRWSHGLLWRCVFLYIKEIILGNIFSVLIIRLINLYSLVLDYLHAQKNSNVRIKGQIGSFSVHISEGFLGCFANLEMMFVMYKKSTS